MDYCSENVSPGMVLKLTEPVETQTSPRMLLELFNFIPHQYPRVDSIPDLTEAFIMSCRKFHANFQRSTTGRNKFERHGCSNGRNRSFATINYEVQYMRCWLCDLIRNSEQRHGLKKRGKGKWCFYQELQKTEESFEVSSWAVMHPLFVPLRMAAGSLSCIPFANISPKLIGIHHVLQKIGRIVEGYLFVQLQNMNCWLCDLIRKSEERHGFKKTSIVHFTIEESTERKLVANGIPDFLQRLQYQVVLIPPSAYRTSRIENVMGNVGALDKIVLTASDVVD
ncbi:hypothetical protein SADUNF_Sadunf16G0019200 [Salix dunnii]|uniref:Uncharacterized protein n=1 Tax=Salix dunnii TaxID=1413687 RepID=A0A835J7H4_9ROSI|nr:hypothetical protein SADUNF_Sadunf16G0019200 [Salix dunnii]